MKPEVAISTEDGTTVCEIMLDKRRVLFFTDASGQIGWAIASDPPDLLRDGSGQIENTIDWFNILRRGINGP